MVGVLSLLLIDLEALLRILPLPADAEIPMSIPALKAISMVQPAVLVAAAVLIGVALAPKVGLLSPVAEAAANGGSVISAIRPQIVPGLLGGLAGGGSIVFTAAVLKPSLPSETVVRLGQFSNMLPIPTRLLYGGITEEVLLRWGFMTLLVWAAWRLFQKGRLRPNPAIVVAAIFVSSLVFAIGHLPVALMLFPEPAPALILFVLVGNSAFGLVGGCFGGLPRRCSGSVARCGSAATPTGW